MSNGVETLEGNTLIHDFMKHKRMKPPFEDRWIGSFTSNDLLYDIDWNWLMSACKKFDKLNLLDKEYESLCDEIDNAVSCYEIKPAFNNLVKGIKWYNTQSKH